jgi:glucan phosphoethanolaminetransferase (alkaline phosphatase superfamily)
MFLIEVYNADDRIAFLLRTYYPQMAIILIDGFVWLSGVLLLTKSGRYFPAFYFLHAAIHVSLANFYDILGNMNLQEPMPNVNLVYEAFFPVALFFLCAAIGAGLWCGLQTFLGKRGDR